MVSIVLLIITWVVGVFVICCFFDFLLAALFLETFIFLIYAHFISVTSS